MSRSGHTGSESLLELSGSSFAAAAAWFLVSCQDMMGFGLLIDSSRFKTDFRPTLTRLYFFLRKDFDSFESSIQFLIWLIYSASNVSGLGCGGGIALK